MNQQKSSSGSNRPDDPMFRTLDKTGPIEKAIRKAKKGNGSSWIFPTIITFLAILLIISSIYLYSELIKSQESIKNLSDNLDSADTRIDQLEEKLYSTQNKLAKQIRITANRFNTLHMKQKNEVDKIKQAIVHKADKTELANVNMKTENMFQDLGKVRTNLVGVNTNVHKVGKKVEELDKRVADQQKILEKQKELISQNIHNINANKSMLSTTRDSLMKLKTSLDRDYFVFQLHKKSGIIRIKDIGLRLKKTRTKSQNYDIEIFFDDKKMKKKKVTVNEPIYFYKMGYKKPYELVINKIAKNRVSGYLSIPKVKE